MQRLLSIPLVLLLFFGMFCQKKEKEKKQVVNAMHEEPLVQLSEKDMILGNVKTDTVRMKNIAEGTNFLGIVAIDENKVSVVSARVQGRIDKLFFKNPGEVLEAGKPMYNIYSEELASTEKIYFDLLSQGNSSINRTLIQSTKEKLKLWGLSNGQIRQLGQARSVSSTATIYSHSSGFITEINVNEGQYVEAGMPLFKLADFSAVWVEGQLYANEAKYLRQSPEVSIIFEDLPGKTYTGHLAYTNPVIEAGSKINLIRYSLNNPDLALKPGMIAYLNMQRGQANAVVIPKDALADYNNMPVVWVEKTKGQFIQRMVKTGRENETDIEIISGLKPGERIAVSGAYLINSEYIVKTGAGRGSMAGMRM